MTTQNDDSSKLPAWLAEFDAYAEKTFAEKAVPGAAVLIVDEGRVVYRRGFGWRDREARLPATASTVFGLASLSKSFTALTALVLQARGQLSLEDRVADLLPGFDYPGLGRGADGRHDVRLWHMLSHTSGVPPLEALAFALDGNQAGDPAAVYNTREHAADPSVDDYDQLMAYMRAGEREAFAEPGRFVSYSNECVALVGAIIERVTGRAFAEVVTESVLEPLGMHTATYATAAAKATGNVATLYTHDPSGSVMRSPVWNEAPAYLGTGFLKASVDDLGKYLAFLIAGDGSRLGVGSELLGELTRPRAWAGPGAGYALGWSVRQQALEGLDGSSGEGRSVSVIRHGGSLKGIASTQGFVPELGLGVVVLTNVDDAPAGRLWQAAINLALGYEAGKAAFDGRGYELVSGRDSDDRILARIAGVYSSGEPWGRLELRVEPALEEAGGAGGRWELQAYSGEDATPVGRLAWLTDDDAEPHEFVLVTEENGREAAWDAGRFHVGADGEFVAVQHSLRWYDKVE